MHAESSAFSWWLFILRRKIKNAGRKNPTGHKESPVQAATILLSVCTWTTPSLLIEYASAGNSLSYARGSPQYEMQL